MRNDITIIGNGAVGRVLSRILQASSYGRSDKPFKAGNFESQTYIIATKAYDAYDAAKQWTAAMRPGDFCYLACNGHPLEILQKLQAEFSTVRWGFCVVSFGARLVNGKLEVTGCTEQSLHFGEVSSPHILWVSQKKWIFNATLNTICCAYSLPRNLLALDYKDVLFELFQESCDLSEKLHGKLKEDRVQLWQELESLIRDTATNENSMARDRRLGYRTEADFFSGRAFGHDGFEKLKNFHFSCAGI